MTADVHTLYASNPRDMSGCLRQIADEIDAERVTKALAVLEVRDDGAICITTAGGMDDPALCYLLQYAALEITGDMIEGEA